MPNRLNDILEAKSSGSYEELASYDTPIYDSLNDEAKSKIDKQAEAISASEEDIAWDASVNMATDFAMGAGELGVQSYLATQPAYVKEYWNTLSTEDREKYQNDIFNSWREANEDTEERRQAREDYTGEIDAYGLTADVAKYVVPTMRLKALGMPKTAEGVVKTSLAWGGFEYGLSHLANDPEQAFQNAVIAGTLGGAIMTPWKRTAEGISNSSANIFNGIIKSKGKLASAAAASALLAGSDAEANPLSGILQSIKQSKNAPKSTEEIAATLEASKGSHVSEELGILDAERQLVTDLEEFQNPDRFTQSRMPNAEMFSGMKDETIKEFAGRLKNDASEIFGAVEDITTKSHLLTKLKPSEGLAEIEESLSGLTADFDDVTTEQVRNALGDIFKTGADGDELISMVNNFDKHIQDIYSKLNRVATKADLDDIERITDDLAMMTHNDSVLPHFNSKGIKQSLFNAGLDRKFTDVAEQLARAKSYSYLPDETKDIALSSSIKDKYAFKDFFNQRKTIRSNTKQLIAKGSLKQEDEIFAFTKRPNEEGTNLTRITQDDLDDIRFKDFVGKKFSEFIPWVKHEPRLASLIKHHDDGTYTVILRKDKPTFKQGAIPSIQKGLRGVEENVLKDNKFADVFEKEYIGLPIDRVAVKLFNEAGEKIIDDFMSHPEYVKAIAKAERTFGHVSDDSKVASVKRPLTREEEELLGRSKDAGDIARATVHSTQAQLGKESMYREIHSKYSSVIGADNAKDFIQNYGKNPKYLFVRPEELKMIDEPELLQVLTNNFIKISDPVMASHTGARYVNKAYAHQLFGYHEMFATVGKYGIPRAMEELWRTSVDIFRSAVIVKNPAALVNNMMAMMFTNMINEYRMTGKVNHKAFTGVKESWREHESFVELIGELHKAKRNGSIQDAKNILELLEDNPAYQLYRNGGLQSLLDDGILNREALKLREGDSLLRNIFLAEGTTAGNYARKLADISDIMNRVNGYKMLREMGMTEVEASREITAVSVNYSKLLEPSQLYARSNGIIPFVAWFSRMTPVMVRMIKENPKRMALAQGMYLATVSTMGSQNGLGDDYIGGVRVESYNPFNSLAPSNWLDPFPTTDILDMTNRIPQALQKDYIDKPEAAIGLTTSM